MFTLVLLLGCFGAALGAATTLADPDVQETTNFLPNDTQEDPIQNVMSKECRGAYTAFCLKLNLVRLVGRGSGMTMSLFPGLSVSSSAIQDVSNSIASSELLQDPDRVDGLLLDRLSDYLGSLSLNVKIMDKSAPLKFAKTYMGDSVASARKKNRFGGALLAAGLMSGGTLMAVGMAAMAAMAGKAMMASMLALLLSALAALKGQGGGGEKTTYEVISKPVVSHLHTHSSEVQHAGHGHYRSLNSGGGHHDASHDVAHDVGHDVAHDVAYAEQAPQAVEHDDYLPIEEHH